MKQPGIPSNERGRLKKLKSLNILDTLPEERFDRLTRMAKRMFNVPIALVSLVDENRQWFKSCVGIEASETPREVSFCGHAILDDKVFIVPDTSVDPRFLDNPLVLNEPNIQFYAGCPLTIDGYRLGTLCLIDHEPRSFNDEDIAALKDLSATIEQELFAMQLATHDDLTGLLNRRGFLSLAQNSLNLSLRKEFPATLVYFDLDKFKFINDNFGHAVGDKILISFATLLNNSFRETDIFARLGGDEFVLLLTNTSLAQAQKVIDKFSHSLELYNQEKQIEHDVLFSSGIVEYNSKLHPSIEKLISDGDKAMYKCKSVKKT